MSSEAFVTLATNDNYCLGALVLAQSLRNVGTTRKIVILITEGVSQLMRECLKRIFDVVQEVNEINSHEDAILASMKRPELGVTLTKILCWRLTQFTKCVFMDADTLPLKNIDELFERDEISAVSDIGWPDCFNSGVFVFKPSESTYNDLVKLAATEGSFDGGDQGLLNTYFSDWATTDIRKHLSFIYNMSSASAYSYLPAYAKFGKNVKVVHFLGSLKPWNYGYNSRSRKVIGTSSSSEQQLQHVRLWWGVFMDQVQPVLVGLAEQLAKLAIDSQDSNLPGGTGTSSTDFIRKHSGLSEQLSQLTLDSQDGNLPGGGTSSVDYQRKQNWEAGNIDFMGADSFDKIQKKLDEALGDSKDSAQ